MSWGSSRSARVAPNRGSGRTGAGPGAGGGGESGVVRPPNREPPNPEPPKRDSPERGSPGSATGARRRDSPLSTSDPPGRGSSQIRPGGAETRLAAAEREPEPDPLCEAGNRDSPRRHGARRTGTRSWRRRPAAGSARRRRIGRGSRPDRRGSRRSGARGDGAEPVGRAEAGPDGRHRVRRRRARAVRSADGECSEAPTTGRRTEAAPPYRPAARRRRPGRSGGPRSPVSSAERGAYGWRAGGSGSGAGALTGPARVTSHPALPNPARPRKRNDTASGARRANRVA